MQKDSEEQPTGSSRRQFLSLAVKSGIAIPLLAACSKGDGNTKNAASGSSAPSSTAASSAGTSTSGAASSLAPAAGTSSAAVASPSAVGDAFAYPATGSPDLKGKLTFWEWDPGKKMWGPEVEPFRKLFPNVEVDVRELGYDDINAKLGVSFQSKSGAPDVSWADGIYLGKFIYQGGLVDLRPILEPYMKDLAGYQLAGATGPDGAIYGWPTDIGPTLLFTNVKVWEPNGLAIPKTWDEMFEAGAKLKSKGIKLIPVDKVPPGSADPLYPILVSQAGGSFFDAQGKPTVESTESIDALRIIRRLVDEGLTTTSGSGNPAFAKEWNSGKVASQIEGAWAASYFGGTLGTKPGEDTGVRAAPSPTLKDGGAKGGVRGGSFLVVPKQGKNQDAALAFVRHIMTSQQANTALWNNGIIPAYIPSLDDPAFTGKPLPEYGGQKVWGIVSEVSKTTPDKFLQPAANAELNTAMAQAWPKFVDGQSPEAWAKDMQAKALRISQKYG